MTRPVRSRVWAAVLMAVATAGMAMPATAHYARHGVAPFTSATVIRGAGWMPSQWHAAASSGVMRVGLTLVAPGSQEALPEPASLDFPATSRAVRCESDGRGYRECRTPFRGPVMLAREVSGIHCIEDQNWGWREGRVWVDRGCAAVFVRIDET